MSRSARNYLMDPESFLSPSPPPPPSIPELSNSRADSNIRLQRSSRRLVRPPTVGGMAPGRRPTGLRSTRFHYESSSSGTGAGHRQTSPADGQPATKRRRKETPFRGGQWEMAPLELEVVEVDGASYHGESQFDVESVLRNDKETYVSRNENCSLTFEHTGKKCFTLQQLVVEAGTYHPVQIQEGAIFVSMSSHDFRHAVDYEFRDSDDEEEDPEDDELSDREDEEVAKKLSEPLNAQASIEYFDEYSQLQPRTSNTTLMQPHARIYTSKKANKCVINFEPALSGRYIHARFYGRQGDNIEIRHIAAYGYTGARLFPALTPR